MSQIFARHLDTPLGRADARLKMALGFTMSVLSILADSRFSLLVLAAGGAAICALSKPGRAQVRMIFISCVLLVWGLMFSQAIFYNQFPRTILVRILRPNGLLPDGVNLYYEGLRYGMVQSLRMLAVVLTGYAICFTTQPDQFFRGLIAMRVPFALSFMAVTAIRFIPVAVQEFTAVRTAMRLKGYRPFRNGLRDTLSTEIASLRPILAGTIRRSEEVAVSIVTRGFAVGELRTSLKEERLSARAWGLLAAMAAVVLGMAVCKALFWLYQYELYYASSLRWLYGIAREWL